MAASCSRLSTWLVARLLALSLDLRLVGLVLLYLLFFFDLCCFCHFCASFTSRSVQASRPALFLSARVRATALHTSDVLGAAAIMDQYDVHKRLGKGAQGAVYLVTDKRTGEQCVMKMVECNDEAEADKAFREAMALEKLKHKYICGYRELFVNWDREKTSMFVCIVMDFYKAGDLDNVIKQYRSKEKAIPEKILKKWFGQMVEALVFIHSQKVVHRDLKPSNMFMSDELDIKIGDFGVATVMQGTKTGTTVGTVNYMAPEVLERPYNETSDIWSLGCILLDASTCGFLDHSQAQSLLFEVKHKPARLEDALQEINKTYSRELCQVIRAMLRRNFHQRPSAKDLTALMFVQSCLSLSKSELVRKDCLSGESEASGAKPTTTKRIPSKVEELPSFMKKNDTRVGCQVAALEEAARLISSVQQEFTTEMLAAVLEAMHDFKNNVWVQTAACQALVAMMQAKDSDPEYRTVEVVRHVLQAMRSHAVSALQQVACQLITVMATEENSAKLLGEQGAVQDVLAAIRDNIDSASLAKDGCLALWSLSLHEANGRIVAEERGIQDIINILHTHSEEVPTITAAISAIWTLSAVDEIVDDLVDEGGVTMILMALRNHGLEHQELTLEALQALAALAVEESCTVCVLDRDEGVDGLQTLIDTAQHYKAEAPVIEALVGVIAEIADHRDSAEVLVESNFTELLMTLKAQHPTDKEIQSRCTTALAALQQ
ncbi:uncharacterized protein MONBRDRAFT_30913 [Monosiga brevicollis MX1]|uniref:non-specific serine/threonine protein kinase n=1 Tax=Monosiga brevicollis TaxID=81824 RepID=A9UQ54_MONBE|nr:uncharacterized protein MONBRDRAFT_30913 [Monosiga brevicollis MX1]EDQ92536.1 predicted protein [Monosiga brevicollis MX1]|eukprot:XP_001742298.1 hypothetical protein [Monosiga brevicollis MX1]